MVEEVEEEVGGTVASTSWLDWTLQPLVTTIILTTIHITIITTNRSA